MAELQKVHDFAKSVDIPIHFITHEEAKRREPDVRAEAGVLESPSTGIIDSHTYMQYLHGIFEDHGGTTALQSPVTRIMPLNKGADGWQIWTRFAGEDEETCITAETLINSAGLFAIPISNMILPPERRRTPYYAKGSYFSYSASNPKPKTLVYPAPMPGHAGLGTHLTLDMGGRIRFGPDVEWIDDPTDYTPNSLRLQEALDDIEMYLPGINREAVSLDYCGIRPKLYAVQAALGDEIASGRQVLDALARHLATSMTEDERLLLEWRATGVPSAEVASWLGEHSGTVRVRLMRLRTRLARAANAYRDGLEEPDRSVVDRFLKHLSPAELAQRDASAPDPE